MRRLVVLALLLAGCAGAPADPYARAPDGVNEETIQVPEQGVASPTFGAEFPMRVVALFRSEGGPIDAWLATEAECARYGTRGFAPAAAALAVTEGRLEAEFEAGQGCIVLDNADFAAGRARSVGPVTVSYRVAVWERAR